MDEWITVKEAARKLSESERNIRLKIQNGKLKAKRDGRRWLINSNLSEEVAEEAAAERQPTGSQSEEATSAESDLVKELREQIQRQVDQIQNLNERIERLEQLLAMEKQQNQQLVDYQLQPFWKKWFGNQKALPAPERVMDVGDAEQAGSDSSDM